MQFWMTRLWDTLSFKIASLVDADEMLIDDLLELEHAEWCLETFFLFSATIKFFLISSVRSKDFIFHHCFVPDAIAA